MAKYKFDKESSSTELEAYFNVPTLSSKQKNQLQVIDPTKLAGILANMPYLAQHLTPKTLQVSLDAEPKFLSGFINNEDVVQSLSKTQKTAIAPELVKVNPLYLFEVPNKKLKAFGEAKNKMIEDAAVGIMKGTDPALRAQNLTIFSEHLVQGRNFFRRRVNNFDSSLYVSLINRVSKDFSSRGPEMLTALFASTQPRLMSAKKQLRSEIVQMGVNHGVSLGAIPEKLRTKDIMYRAIMKSPEQIQFAPNPVDKALLVSFVKAASNQIIKGHDKDGKYADMLSELIANRKITTPPVKLSTKVKDKFISKTLKNEIKKNPALFVSLKNLKSLGFDDKTIRANKIIALKTMNTTKQRAFLSAMTLAECNDMAKNMKKLSPNTRKNLSEALKQKAKTNQEVLQKDYDAKLAAHWDLGAKMTRRENELKQESNEYVKKYDTLQKEMADSMLNLNETKDILSLQEHALNVVEKNIATTQTELAAASKQLSSLQGKQTKALNKLAGLDATIQPLLAKEKELVASLADTKISAADKVAIKTNLDAVKQEIQDARELISIAQEGLEVANNNYAKGLEAKNTIEASFKEMQESLTQQQIVHDKYAKQAQTLSEAFEAQKAQLATLAKEHPDFSPIPAENLAFIEKTLSEEFPDKTKIAAEYEEATAKLKAHNAEYKEATEYVHNLDKGKDTTAHIGKKEKAKVHTGVELSR